MYQYKLMQQTFNLIRKGECIQSICLISHLQFRKKQSQVGMRYRLYLHKKLGIGKCDIDKRKMYPMQPAIIYFHTLQHMRMFGPSNIQTKYLCQMNIIFVCTFTYDIYRLPLRNYTFDVVIWIRKKHFQNSTHQVSRV